MVAAYVDAQQVERNASARATTSSTLSAWSDPHAVDHIVGRLELWRAWAGGQQLSRSNELALRADLLALAGNEPLSPYRRLAEAIATPSSLEASGPQRPGVGLSR